MLADARPTPPPVEASYENQGKLQIASLQESRVRMSTYKKDEELSLRAAYEADGELAESLLWRMCRLAEMP
jgi:hypothetical protein